MTTPAKICLGLMMLMHTGTAALSENNLASEEIVNALRGEPVQATRSLTGSTSTGNAISDDDRGFLNGLNTRGLRVETLTKVSNIIDNSDLPSLDMEIVFEFNSTEIREESLANLDALGSALSNDALAGAQIMLNGHTDAKGSETYNLELSQRRAESVMQYLLEAGVKPAQLTARGYGEYQPIASNVTPEGRAENRRVELRVLND